MATPAATLAVLVTANTGQATKALGGLEAQLRATAVQAETTSGRIKAAGAAAGARLATFAKYGATAGVALGAASAKMAYDFEESMTRVRNLVGASQEQVHEWSDDLLELSGKVGKSPQELAEGLYFVASSGIKASKVLKTTAVAAKASSIGLGETEVVADALTSALNAYAKSGLTAADAANVMIKTVKYGKLEADQLAGTLGKVIPVSSKLGVNFDDVGAALAAMSLQGLNAAEATTALRAIFTSVIKPQEQSEQALAKVGLSAEKLRDVLEKDGTLAMLQLLSDKFKGNVEAMGQVFPNVRALVGAFNLTGENADQTAKIFQQLGIDTDDLGKGFENWAKTPAGQMNKALGAIQGAMTELGAVILPEVAEQFNKFAQIVTSDKLTKDEKVSALIEQIGDSVEKYGPQLGKLGGQIAWAILKGIVSSFWNADLLGKLFIGAGALRLFGGKGAIKGVGLLLGRVMGGGIAGGMTAGLALTFVLLAPEVYKWSHKLGEQLKKPIRDFFTWMVDTFGDVADKVLGVFTTLIGAVGDIYDEMAGIPVIGAAFKPIAAGLHDVEDRINGVRDAMRDIREFRKDPLGFTKTTLAENNRNIASTIDALMAMGVSYKRASRIAEEAYLKTGDNAKVAARTNQQALDTIGKNFNLDARNTDRWADKGGKDLGRVNKNLDDSADKHANYAQRAGKAFSHLVGDSAKAAAAVVGNNANMVNTVGQGQQTLRKNTQNALDGFGVKDAIRFSIQLAKQATRTIKNLATGGLVPGVGSGDTVPLHIGGRLAAMVEPGEQVSVLNRRATAALMAGNKEHPRFGPKRLAKGGLVTGDTDYSPEMAQAMNALASGTGRSIFVQSGGRTLAEQAALYQAYLNGTGNLAAPPNPNAPHVQGIAADITPGQSVFGSVAGRYGLGFPVPGESWHIQLMDPSAASGGTSSAAKAPKIGRVLLKGPKGPLRDTGQAALDKTVRAARKFVASKMPSGGAGVGGGGGSVTAKNLPPALQKYNHVYPNAMFPSQAWQNLYQMPFDAVAALAEWAGAPGITFAQVSQGEGVLRPGSSGDDNGDGQPDGYGLWAITRPYGDSYGVKALGGYDPGMFNPVSNAIVMGRMYQAQGPSAWYGIGHVTGWNQHYSGPLLKRQAGGVVPFGGWFGNGGSITAHRPTLVGIGDGPGSETATITRGPQNGSQPVRLVIEDGYELRAYLESAIDEGQHGRAQYARQKRRMRR